MFKQDKASDGVVVKFTSAGPAGYVYYSEDGETLPFDWQRNTVGFDIYLPSSEEWNSFCDEHNAVRARNRRQEIVTRLAQEISRTEAKGSKVTIDGTGISFSYEHSLLRKLMSKILGLD